MQQNIEMQNLIQEPQQNLYQIFNDLTFIENESSASDSNNIQLQKSKKFLLFFGFQHDDVAQLYAHFIEKRVLVQNEYIKIVELKKGEKASYLINTPYSLDGMKDSQLCVKICITRIILEKFLLRFREREYHIIVNSEKLQGETLQEKINFVTGDKLFSFGQLMFKNEKISYILNINNKKEISYFLVKNEKDVQQLKHILKEQTLKEIFKKDIFYKIKKGLIQDYGPMTLNFQKIINNYINQINNILIDYLNKLLYLQQIPNIDDEKNLKQELILLIGQLNDFFLKNTKSKTNLEFAFSLITQINTLNKNHGAAINDCLKTQTVNIFLKEKNISLEDMQIPDVLIKEEDIEFINKVLKQCIKEEFDKENVSQIKNLECNIQYWKNCFSKEPDMIESIIYKFKQMIQEIQKGPSNESEIGVFLFGKTRVGKSTLINLLQNPESLQVSKEVNDLCYAIKDGYQTEFIIDHSIVSQTQKISSMQIGDVSFYDCPGFDDNKSEEMRIAHRISLYNYLKKTKKVIAIFLVGSSIQNVSVIKDTIDPIYDLLEQSDQLKLDNNKWASLVLVKTKENERKNCIETWDKTFKDSLIGRYEFYKKMYENDNQCIEFPQPKENQTAEYILQQNIYIRNNILSIINQNKMNQDFLLKFNLNLGKTLARQLSTFLNVLQIKIEQIICLLENEINTYIIEDEDIFENKKFLMEEIQWFIVEKITAENVQDFLRKILFWCQLNERFQKKSKFLQGTIYDILESLKILDYSYKIQIPKITIDVSIIKKNVNEINKIMKKIEEYKFGLQAGVAITVVALVGIVSSVLISQGTYGVVALYACHSTISKSVLMSGGIGTLSGGAISILILNNIKQYLLKHFYEIYLKEQEKKD